MTESNITREHEGKHGVLTLGDTQRNHVTIYGIGDWRFTVLIDGATSKERYSLPLSDGWQFTPDPDPLPTEPGWYVCTSEAGSHTPALYSLGMDGWIGHYTSTSTHRTLASMASIHADDPLVRVSFGVAS